MALLDMLTDQLAGERTAQIGRQLGTDEGTAGKAIAAALPMLMGALAKAQKDVQNEMSQQPKN